MRKYGKMIRTFILLFLLIACCVSLPIIMFQREDRERTTETISSKTEEMKFSKETMAGKKEKDALSEALEIYYTRSWYRIGIDEKPGQEDQRVKKVLREMSELKSRGLLPEFINTENPTELEFASCYIVSLEETKRMSRILEIQYYDEPSEEKMQLVMEETSGKIISFGVFSKITDDSGKYAIAVSGDLTGVFDEYLGFPGLLEKYGVVITDQLDGYGTM